MIVLGVLFSSSSLSAFRSHSDYRVAFGVRRKSPTPRGVPLKISTHSQIGILTRDDIATPTRCALMERLKIDKEHKAVFSFLANANLELF